MIVHFFLCLVLLWSVQATKLYAAENLIDMIARGKFSGQVRLFYIDRNFTGIDLKRNATAIGGYLKYDTDVWNGLSFGAAVYTTNRILQGVEYENVDPSLFGTNLSSYVFPGEAYVNFRYQDTYVKIGRQQLQTPMICGDDARMIACLYEAFNLRNFSFDDTELTLGHIIGVAPGTIANTYPNGGVLAITAGYSFIGAQANNKFHNMGYYAIGQSTPGVTVFGAKYKGLKPFNLQAWNYVAWEMMNTLYLQADVIGNMALPYNPDFFLSLQYILQQTLGGNIELPDINSHYWAIKLGVNVDAFRFFAAYSQTGTDPGAAINGGVISPWGGMPAYTQGMVTRHMFMAGTHAWKVKGSYLWNFSDNRLFTALYFVSYAMDPLNGFSPGEKWTATEAGVDIEFRPGWQKNLSLQFRANFTDDFFKSSETAFGWNEIRFILNYDF